MPIDRERLSQALPPAQLVALTEALIRLPSYDGVPKQETAVARHIHAVLQNEGIESWVEEVCDGRCNVYGRLRGSGGGKTLMLNGHIDTVPPYDMEDALVPKHVGGRLYGRGVSDMKGPVAAMVMSLVALKRLGIAFSGDVLFCGVIDEELRSFGTSHLLEAGLKADAAIVGEPTDCQVCVAHRGLEWYEFTFHGKTVHGGAQDGGVNAISKAARFIRAVEEDLAPKLARRTHPLLERATVNVGVIHGGTQLSTVAGECTVLLDRRFLPQERYEDLAQEFKELLDRLAAGDPDFLCEMKVTDNSRMKPGYVHMPLETPQDHPLVELVQHCQQQATGNKRPITYFPAWTDAGLLSHYGHIPTVVCGPGYISCCHSKEEYIETKQLEEGLMTYVLAAAGFCR